MCIGLAFVEVGKQDGEFVQSSQDMPANSIARQYILPPTVWFVAELEEETDFISFLRKLPLS
jgi:hypothetical protein